MSENTPEMGEPATIEAADMSICFHGTEVYIAKAAGTGESLVALRIKGHAIDPKGEVVELHPEIKTFEIILNALESIEVLTALLTGHESIMSVEMKSLFGDLRIPKGEWN
jgi:hypothetical protein